MRPINKEKKLEAGAMLEFVIYDPMQKQGKKLTFHLAIIAEENSREQKINYYGYVCVEDNNLYTSQIYSGGQTGSGVDLSNIQKFNDKDSYCKREFVKFL